MNAIYIMISIIMFGITALYSALIIDMLKNGDRNPSIFLFVLLFGTSVYLGLWSFLKSIGFL